MMPNEIIKLQEAVNTAIKNMGECYKEKERKFFYDEYIRLKKLLDEKMNEYAEALLNFDVI